MKTISGLPNLKTRLKDTVVVVGVFDGLHRGHRYLMRKAVSLAGSSNKISVCITFHPHPQGEPYLISLKAPVIKSASASPSIPIRKANLTLFPLSTGLN